MAASTIYLRSGAFDMKATYQKNLVLSWILTYGGILLVVIGFKVAELYSQPIVLLVAEEPIEVRRNFDDDPIVIVRDKTPFSPTTRRSIVDYPPIPVPRPDEEFVDEDPQLPGQSTTGSYGIGDSSAVGDNSSFVEGVSDGGDWPEPFAFIPVEKRPEMIFRAEVEYPRLAKAAGLAGTVWVRALVDEEGNVIKAILHCSSGVACLDEAALQSARRNRFTPAVQNARAVKVWVSYSVEFSLMR